MWLVQGTRTVCSAFLCNENKKLGLLTPAPVFFDFIFLLPGRSSLHLCLGILGHKSTNDRRKWTKSHLVIGNPVNNLNIVVDTSQVDELHPDKQHLSQMFPVEKIPYVFLIQNLTGFTFRSKEGQRRVFFHFVFEQTSIDTFWASFPLIIAEKRNKGWVSPSECLMNYGLRFVTLYRDRDQDHPHGKEIRKSKMAVWGGLTNSCERREVKSKGEKGR